MIEFDKKNLRTYVFFREDMFYMIDLYGDVDAVANALCNPGTARVEDLLTSRVVWPNEAGATH